MGITWSAAADRHGIDHADALHAMANAVYIEVAFDAPRPPAQTSPTLFIGPQRDPSAPLLEVMIEPRPPRGFHVFHVMIARPKHLARIPTPVRTTELNGDDT